MEQSVCLYDRYIKDFRCKYYITKTTKKFIDDKDSVNVYGVKIDKLDRMGGIISSAAVSEVGINENDVRRFLKVLNDGRVTPITLQDIVKDNMA